MTPNRTISNVAAPRAIVAGTSPAGHAPPAQAHGMGNGPPAGAPMPLRFPCLPLVLLTLGLTCGTVAPVSAQTTGPVSFTSTEAAVTGTVACNGGAPTPIAAVDASTTVGTGSNNAVATNLSASACNLPLYDIASANHASSASDTTTQDEGAGNSSLEQVSLLNGVVTYDAKTETDTCTATTDTQGAVAVNCTDTTTIQNLTFAGQHITGTFTQPATFNAVSVSVQLPPGSCTGLGVFTGQLTVAGSSTQTSGNTTELDIVPVALQGTLTCVGLPLTSLTVSLQDTYAETATGDNINPETYNYITRADTFRR